MKDRTGKSAFQFIDDFVASKVDSGVEVLSRCGAVDQGLFSRTCLETIEGPHHILYSLFWGTQDLDVAVVSISGTTTELWDEYAPVFQRMGGFELMISFKGGALRAHSS